MNTEQKKRELISVLKNELSFDTDKYKYDDLSPQDWAANLDLRSMFINGPVPEHYTNETMASLAKGLIGVPIRKAGPLMKDFSLPVVKMMRVEDGTDALSDENFHKLAGHQKKSEFEIDGDGVSLLGRIHVGINPRAPKEEIFREIEKLLQPFQQIKNNLPIANNSKTKPFEARLIEMRKKNTLAYLDLTIVKKYIDYLIPNLGFKFMDTDIFRILDGSGDEDKYKKFVKACLEDDFIYWLDGIRNLTK